MKTIKEITIEQIDYAYETLERISHMDNMKSIHDTLWQNFSGQAAGAAITGASILREMDDNASANDVLDHYNHVVAPKFEKLYKKMAGLEEA